MLSLPAHLCEENSGHSGPDVGIQHQDSNKITVCTGLQEERTILSLYAANCIFELFADLQMKSPKSRELQGLTDLNVF